MLPIYASRSRPTSNSDINLNANGNANKSFASVGLPLLPMFPNRGSTRVLGFKPSFHEKALSGLIESSQTS